MSGLRRAASWLVGAAVGLAGLAVVGVILWFCVQLVIAEPNEKHSRLEGIALAYAFAFVAVVVGVACARLIVPWWRTKEGGILDGWSFRVLGGIYGLIVLAGVALNFQDAVIPITVIVLGALLVAALRATFGWPPRGKRPED